MININNKKRKFLQSSLSLILLLNSQFVQSAQFSLSGCYASSDVQALTYNNAYTFQSSGYCEQQCANSRVAALINGKYCYCGDESPSSSNQVSSTNCNVACQGYPYENCGGNGYYMVYVNAQVQDSESSSAQGTTTGTTSSSTGTSSATSSTSTTNPQSSTPATSTNSPTSTSSTTSSSSSTSQNKITIVSTLTTDPSGSAIESIIYKTVIADPSPTDSASQSSSASPTSSSSTPSGSDSSDSSKSSHSKSHSKLSAGGIAGVVIGGLAGLGLIIGAIVFFLWRKRRNSDDDYEEDDYSMSPHALDEKAAIGGFEPPPPPMVGPNPFLLSAGYNHFDTSQQQPQAQGDNKHYSTSSGTQSDRESSQGFTILGGGANANGSNGHSRSGSRVINHSNDPSFNSMVGQEFDFSNGNGNPATAFQQPEFGRRRLSNGSLPDMIARQPGSLKVVNN
ncbi:uncharacterized protein RJT21DRAFT_113237 [Scheffersomyces amazonensis]|uniref:uncharacterized protein n=1 Tax=Scheffersomyces amazonensis TaxID=1078765 RepID=UPI00315D9F01